MIIIFSSQFTENICNDSNIDECIDLRNIFVRLFLIFVIFTSIFVRLIISCDKRCLKSKNLEPKTRKFSLIKNKKKKV